MGTKTYVYLAVFDFGDDPEVVSAMMGMEPTKAWVKGEHYVTASPDARRTHSRWTVDSGLDQTEPLEAHLSALLTKIEPRHAVIQQVAQRFPAHIGVAQYLHEVNPQFELKADILRRFASLGLPISFDQYCVQKDEGS